MYKKKLGQHFLIDKFIIDNFIKIINPNKNINFIEIGSGSGLLTKYFINLSKKIFLIELDNKLCNILLNKFSNNENVFILNKDARFINISKLYKKKLKYIIFGSIPYYATIPIIFNLSKYVNFIDKIYFIIQRELSFKLVAECKDSFYSKLSIMNRLFFKTYILYENIKPSSFYPKPKVYSSIIKMIPDNYIKFNSNLEKNNFYKIVKESFIKKRKMIKNSLSKIINIDKIKNIKEIDIKSRPQDISIKQYYLLSKLL